MVVFAPIIRLSIFSTLISVRAGRGLTIWHQIDDFYNNGDFDNIDDFNHKDDDSFYNSSKLLTGIKEAPTTAEFC